MHEFGLCEAIVSSVRGRAQGRSVIRVRVRISELLRAEFDSMEQAFEMVTVGTELAGAQLELVAVPGRGTCVACGAEVEVRENWDPCSECGEHAVSPANAEEMILEAIEYRSAASIGGG